MYSLLLLALGVALLALTAWTWWQWRTTGAGIVLFVLLPLAGSAWEALVAGSGRFTGPGDGLRDSAGLTVLWWSFTLPLALFTFATVSRRLRFAWARIDWGHGLVCIGAVVLLFAELPRMFGSKRIWPVCWQDVVAYAPVVPPGQLCAGAPLPGESPAATWLAPWIVFGAFAALGVGLAVTRRWPWLAVGTGAGLALLALPPAWVGPVPAIAGRGLALAAMALAAVRYAGLPPLDAPDGPGTNGQGTTGQGTTGQGTNGAATESLDPPGESRD
jgi:hypothetical protein